MNLDELAIELRPRTSGEATDLGFTLLRHFWWPVLAAWVPAVLGLLIVGLAVYSMTELAGLALLAIWVLKPAFDHLPLFVLSRSVFGDTPSVRRTLGDLARGFVSWDVINMCTIRRFSPYRSVSIPVRQLEGTSGTHRKRRLDEVLNADVSQSAASVLMAGHMFEMLAIVGLYLGAWMVVPAEFRPVHAINPTNLGTLQSADIMLICTYTLAYAFAGPLAVAGGFGQYLNRRVQLEGWDVELTFRRLTRRLTGPQRHSHQPDTHETDRMTAVDEFDRRRSGRDREDDSRNRTGRFQGLMVLLTVTACLLVSVPAFAQSESGGERPAPKEAAQQVLDAPEFGQKETRTVRELRDEYTFDNEPEEREPGSAIGQALGAMLEILLWGVAAAGLGFLAWALIKTVDTDTASSRTASGDDSSRIRQPEDDHSMRLPGDIAGSAADAWRDGRLVDALSLLYRGTLEGLSERYGMTVTPGMTARTCARRVEQLGGPRDYMHELARAWTSTVYADRPPTDKEVESLIEGWRREFQSRPEEDST